MEGVLGVLFAIIAFPVMWAVVIALIAQLSGWQRLAEVYASPQPPGLDKRHMCSLRIGKNAVNGARYNGVMTIGVNADGIWLRPFFPFSFRHPGLFLPFLDAKGEEVPGIIGSWFDITVSGVPELHLRVSESVGRWIEETAMAQRGGEQ